MLAFAGLFLSALWNLDYRFALAHAAQRVSGLGFNQNPFSDARSLDLATSPSDALNPFSAVLSAPWESVPQVGASEPEAGLAGRGG